MPMATLSIAAPMATPITVPKAMVLPSFMAALPGLSTAAPLDIRRTRTSVRPVRLINPGFEIGGLFDQARCHVWVRDSPCEFEKRSCLTRQILPAHHRCHLPLAVPQTLRCNAGIVPSDVLRSAHLIFVPSDACGILGSRGLPEPTPADHVFAP